MAFYTRLPSFLMVLSVFNILKDYVAHTSRNALSQFEEMMLFFIRMRLRSPMQDLAYRFDVSQSTASRVCKKWLDVFYEWLGSLVRCPDKEEVMKTMPVAFAENFDLKVRVILDCFEVFIQRPSSLITRSETWSHYKHHNTVEFLLAICPQGMVTFISQTFGGHASDKHITEDSGALHLALWTSLWGESWCVSYVFMPPMRQLLALICLLPYSLTCVFLGQFSLGAISTVCWGPMTGQVVAVALTHRPTF